MIHQIIALGTGVALTAALLIIEHLLWSDTRIETRYLLGTGAVCAGCTLAGLIAEDLLLAIGPWVVASPGLLIIAWRHSERQAAERERGARKNGEIIGAARGLTQEIIDSGGRHDAEPGMDQARYRN